MASTKIASVPNYTISHNFAHNHNKHVDENLTAIRHLPHSIGTKPLEINTQFYSDLFDAKYHNINEDNGKLKSAASPTIFADDNEMNLISSFSSGNSLDEFSLGMIKWPGLDDSNNSFGPKSNENRVYYFDGVGSEYQANSNGNWSPYGNPKNLLLDDLTSFGDGNLSPFSDTNMSNAISINICDNTHDSNNCRHMISNSDYFEPSMFYSNNNNYVNAWSNNNLSLDNGTEAPPLPNMSQQEIESKAKFSAIIESCFDLLNKGDYISGSFTPLISQSDMHKCLIHVIQSLLDASHEIDIIFLYQKVFEKFTLDISMLDIPSVGSFLHNEGYCKPCVFANKKTKTCENGSMCYFCHYVHKDVRQRVKSKRNKNPSKKSNCKTTNGSNAAVTHPFCNYSANCCQHNH